MRFANGVLRRNQDRKRRQTKRQIDPVKDKITHPALWAGNPRRQCRAAGGRERDGARRA
jgi:hypothetical protein